MGAFQMGPPVGLVLALQAEYGIETFVEAGTFHGETAAWASRHFRRVVTIEAAPVFANRARRRFAGSSVEVREGVSVDHLRSLMAELSAPGLFWLDAHWSGGSTAGREDECPLLRELQLFNEVMTEHFLLVDDARLFAAPPPRPHDPAHWPSLEPVVTALGAGGRRHVMLIDDVFVGVPAVARPFLVGYWQQELERRATRPGWHVRGAALLERIGRRLERPAALDRSDVGTLT